MKEEITIKIKRKAILIHTSSMKCVTIGALTMTLFEFRL